jgi:hypothetical protein
MNRICLCQGFIVIVLILIICRQKRNEGFVVSTVDNNKYDVLDTFEDKDVAADILARINLTNQKFISYLQNHGGSRQKIMGDLLRKRYRPDNIIENDPPDKWNTSYTEDKGKLLAICLREKESGKNKFHTFDLLLFVSLHELAHIGSIEYGHDEEFWNNFAFILHQAHESGIYNPVDYSKYPVNYCGLDVTNNPFFD